VGEDLKVRSSHQPSLFLFPCPYSSVKRLRFGAHKRIYPPNTVFISAIYLARAFCNRGYREPLDMAVRVGGDVDTISAMAGAIWGARHGASHLPRELVDQIEDGERIAELAASLADVMGKKRSRFSASCRRGRNR
jgi:hypothetical protein